MSIIAPKRRGGIRVRDDAGAPLVMRPYLNAGTNLSAADDGTQIVLNAVGGGGGSYPGTILSPSGGDDTAAVQNALNTIASGGHRELVIDGMLSVPNGGLTYDGPAFSMRGLGRNASGFTMSSTTAMLLTIGTSTSYAGRHLISNLTFVGPQGGLAGVSTQTSGGGLLMAAGGSESLITNCQFLGLYESIYLGGGNQQVTIKGCEFFSGGHSYVTVALNQSGGSSPGGGISTYGGGYGSEFWIDGCSMYGGGGFGPGAVTNGIKWIATDAGHITGNSIVACGTGINFSPVAARQPENGVGIVSHNIISDNSVRGVYINGTSYQWSKMLFSTNHHCYNGIGIEVAGANTNGINFNGEVIHCNGTIGLKIGSGAKNIFLRDSMVNGNPTCGVDIASGVTDFHITNNRITSGNFSSPAAATQNYGIRYGGSHDNCIIIGNDLRGNATAATTGTAPTASSTVVVANNI